MIFFQRIVFVINIYFFVYRNFLLMEINQDDSNNTFFNNAIPDLGRVSIRTYNILFFELYIVIFLGSSPHTVKQYCLTFFSLYEIDVKTGLICITRIQQEFQEKDSGKN